MYYVIRTKLQYDMYIARKIHQKVDEGLSFQQLLEAAKTDDRIFLQNVGKPSMFDLWSVGRHGLILVKDDQLILYDNLIARGVLWQYDGDPWRAAGAGVVLLKNDGLHYIANGEDRIICDPGSNDWEPSPSGIMVNFRGRIVEYPFDTGKEETTFVPEGARESATWHPHHQAGVLVDIGDGDDYKIAHFSANGESNTIYDEEKDGAVGVGDWFPHPAGIVLLADGKLYLNGVPYRTEERYELCYSSPSLPGVVALDKRNDAYLLVHKD